MSKWEKLLARITSLSKDLRFEELRRVLESCGYTMHAPRGGSSHYTFRKPGCDRSPCRSMSRSSAYMWSLSGMLWKVRAF